MPDVNRILTVVDPTADTQPAVERASWLAGLMGAHLELFICDYDQYLAGERFFDTSALQKARAQLIENHIGRLNELTRAIDQTKITVTVDARWDYPLHEGIVRKAREWKADLVVKDTHYHPVIKRSLFSNTDWQLIRTCPVSLLLVKPRPIGSPPSLLAAVDPVHEHDKPAQLDREILDLSLQLASALGADLRVFHAFDPAPAYAVSADALAFPISAPIKEIAEALRVKHVDAMNDLLSEYPQIGSDSLDILEGETRELLVGLTQKRKTDILVIGAVSRSAAKRLLVGSTAESVLDHVPCDILIVKPSTLTADEY